MVVDKHGSFTFFNLDSIDLYYYFYDQITIGYFFLPFRRHTPPMTFNVIQMLQNTLYRCELSVFGHYWYYQIKIKKFM